PKNFKKVRKCQNSQKNPVFEKKTEGLNFRAIKQCDQNDENDQTFELPSDCADIETCNVTKCMLSNSWFIDLIIDKKKLIDLIVDYIKLPHFITLQVSMSAQSLGSSKVRTNISVRLSPLPRIFILASSFRSTHKNLRTVL
ncbi:hypothetical protein BpHYR1_028192, partial [Brachionus plicatilis]